MSLHRKFRCDCETIHDACITLEITLPAFTVASNHDSVGSLAENWTTLCVSAQTVKVKVPALGSSDRYLFRISGRAQFVGRTSGFLYAETTGPIFLEVVVGAADTFCNRTVYCYLSAANTDNTGAVGFGSWEAMIAASFPAFTTWGTCRDVICGGGWYYRTLTATDAPNSRDFCGGINPGDGGSTATAIAMRWLNEACPTPTYVITGLDYSAAHAEYSTTNHAALPTWGCDYCASTGSGTGTGTGTSSGSSTGSGSQTGTGSGQETGSGSGSNTGTSTGSNSGSNSGTSTGSDSGSNSGTGTSSGSSTGSSTGSSSGSSSGSGSGSGTQVCAWKYSYGKPMGSWILTGVEKAGTTALGWVCIDSTHAEHYELLGAYTGTGCPGYDDAVPNPPDPSEVPC